MTRYWVIAPSDARLPEIWERIWHFNISNSVISIGWHELGDPSSLTESELKSAFQHTYGDTRSANMLRHFYHSIQKDDIVIARQGRKRIAAVGTVLRSAYYHPTLNMEATGSDQMYPNHLDVRWHDTPRDKEFDRIVFGMQTITEIDESRYRELVGGFTENTSDIMERSLGTEFVLEKYLEDFIISNFMPIFRDELVLYKDPEENVIGQQYATDVGIIDILAQEPNSGNFVVIELKKGRESDKVVGQTLRYMGWVDENLCHDGQTVKGMIICRGSDPKLAYALKMTHNIVVKYYRVDFNLSDTPFDLETGG